LLNYKIRFRLFLVLKIKSNYFSVIRLF